VGLVDHGNAEVGGKADDHDVEDRADARHLPQRDPQQQDQRADSDRDLAKGQWEVMCHSFVEDVPRIEAEGRLHHHRHGEAVQK